MTITPILRIDSPDDRAADIARVRRMLVCPDMAMKRPVLLRRLFALESEMSYHDTFDATGETLFAVWRAGRPEDR